MPGIRRPAGSFWRQCYRWFELLPWFPQGSGQSRAAAPAQEQKLRWIAFAAREARQEDLSAQLLCSLLELTALVSLPPGLGECVPRAACANARRGREAAVRVRLGAREPDQHFCLVPVPVR